MSEPPTESGTRDQAAQYEIYLRGRLDPRWATWFDGLTLTLESDGTTCLHGLVVDQAALFGLLHKVRDTGLPLVSLQLVEPDPPDARSTTADD